jgi:hypothetical protein
LLIERYYRNRARQNLFTTFSGADARQHSVTLQG